MLFSSAVAVLIVFYFLNVDLETALLIPSGAAIIVYIIGSAAGVRLLKEKGAKRILPVISLVISILVLPFIGVLLSGSIFVVILALLYATYARKRQMTRFLTS